jgi:hypothetical protein
MRHTALPRAPVQCLGEIERGDGCARELRDRDRVTGTARFAADAFDRAQQQRDARIQTLERLALAIARRLAAPLADHQPDATPSHLQRQRAEQDRPAPRRFARQRRRERNATARPRLGGSAVQSFGRQDQGPRLGRLGARALGRGGREGLDDRAPTQLLAARVPLEQMHRGEPGAARPPRQIRERREQRAVRMPFERTQQRIEEALFRAFRAWARSSSTANIGNTAIHGGSPVRAGRPTEVTAMAVPWRWARSGVPRFSGNLRQTA